MGEALSPEQEAFVSQSVDAADIVVGIPSYNNARTIGHVVRAVHAGLGKYFPQFRSVIANSDGGSRDGTQAAVLQTRIEDAHVLLAVAPMSQVHRLSLPYQGIAGKGSAFRLIFQIARKLGAKAVAVVDSDLRSITPEWVDLLLRPVLHAGYDFVAPYYHRHKYDGTITNSIVYPLTRALYGLRVRQPIGGDFGMSGRMVARYLERDDDWETDVARYGIDIWMTTTAIAEGFRVCQSFLGAKLHDAKDPGSDLSAMLHQVVGSVFMLMEEYAPLWRARTGSEPAELFGFRFDVGLDPIDVNLQRMLDAFRRGCSELNEIWSMALRPETLGRVKALAVEDRERFRIDDDLWTRLIYEFACAHRRMPVERGHLLRSLTPLYLGRVASFVIETQPMYSAEVEQRMEQLCLSFERLKPYLISLWSETGQPVSPGKPAGAGEEVRK